MLHLWGIESLYVWKAPPKSFCHSFHVFHSHRKSRLDLPQLSFDSLFVVLHLESRIFTNSNNTIRLSTNKILLDDRNLEGNQFSGNILYSPQQLSKLMRSTHRESLWLLVYQKMQNFYSAGNIGIRLWLDRNQSWVHQTHGQLVWSFLTFNGWVALHCIHGSVSQNKYLCFVSERKRHGHSYNNDSHTFFHCIWTLLLGTWVTTNL